MAEQTGTIRITGTISGICFYQMQRKHYARLKSSLSSKRVKTSAAFKKTMMDAALLAHASRIASAVYRVLPKERKGRKLYQQLTGMAMQLLKKGITKEDVIALLKNNAGLNNNKPRYESGSGFGGPPAGRDLSSGNGINSLLSVGGNIMRPCFQSSLACSIRSLRDETKFHQINR